MEHRQHTRKIKFVKHLTNLWSPQCTSTDNNFADCRTSAGFYNLWLRKIPNSVEHRNSNLTLTSRERNVYLSNKRGFYILKLSVNRYVITGFRFVLITIKLLEGRSNDIRILSYSSWIAWFRAIGFNLFAAVIISARMLTNEDWGKEMKEGLKLDWGRKLSRDIP